MYNKAYNDWIDVPGLAATLVTYHTRSTGGDEAKARYWNLIEAMPNVRRDDGSDRVGWWRLTAQGISFVRNEIVIAKHARIYDGRCLGLDNTQLVSIIDVLGKRFNYRELMDGL